MAISAFKLSACVAALLLSAAGIVRAQDEPAAEPAETTVPAETGAAADDAAAEPAVDADPLVAVVNGVELRRSAVIQAFQNLPPQFQQLPPEMLINFVVDQLIAGELIAEQAYAEGLDADPEVQAEVDRAERQILQQVWLQHQIEAAQTDENLQQAYAEHLASNPPQEEVSARHILVGSEEEAQAIIDQLDAGGDFATLATENSTDPGSGPNGGDLGWFTHDQMVTPFADAAFALQPGETSSAPVQSDFGWHVIHVDDRRMQAQPTLDEIRPQLQQELTEQVVRDRVDALRAAADITMYGPDGQPLPEEPAVEETPTEDAPAEEAPAN